MVDLSKYLLQQSAQLVVPFYNLEVTLTFCLCFSRFKILYDTLQIYRSTLSSLYLCPQHIKLILSDGSHVVHTQHVGCHHLLTVKYRKIAHIVIEKGCSCPSMLDFWMPTHIVGGTKNAIQLFQILLLLTLRNVKIVEVKALKCFIHAVLIKTLPHDIKTLHDGINV